MGFGDSGARPSLVFCGSCENAPLRSAAAGSGFDWQLQLLPLGTCHLVSVEPPLPVGCSQPMTEQGRSTEVGHPAEMQSLSDYAFAQGCPINIVEPFLESCCSLRFLAMQPAFSPFPLPKCQTSIILVWKLSSSCPAPYLKVSSQSHLVLTSHTQTPHTVIHWLKVLTANDKNNLSNPYCRLMEEEAQRRR